MGTPLPSLKSSRRGRGGGGSSVIARREWRENNLRYPEPTHKTSEGRSSHLTWRSAGSHITRLWSLSAVPSNYLPSIMTAYVAAATHNSLSFGEPIVIALIVLYYCGGRHQWTWPEVSSRFTDDLTMKLIGAVDLDETNSAQCVVMTVSFMHMNSPSRWMLPWGLLPAHGMLGSDRLPFSRATFLCSLFEGVAVEGRERERCMRSTAFVDWTLSLVPWAFCAIDFHGIVLACSLSFHLRV